MSDCYDKPATLVLKQGDTWKRRFICKQGDVPLDLSFTEAVFKVNTPYNRESVIWASTEDETVIIYPDQGVIDVYLDWRITAGLEPVLYVAELELYFLDGTRESSPLFYIRVLEDISKFEKAVPLLVQNLGISNVVKKARYG